MIYHLVNDLQVALNKKLNFIERNSTMKEPENDDENHSLNSQNSFQNPYDIITQLQKMMSSIKDAFVSLNNLQTKNSNSGENKSNNFSRIDMSIPQFSDEYQNNPIEFLDNLKQYLMIKNIPVMCQSLIIKTAFNGRAKSWFMANSQKWKDFSEFESDFLSEFFSIEFRTEMTNAWRDRRFTRMDGTFVNYFYEQVRQACYLEPPLADYSRNFSIVSQFPRRVQESMSTVNLSDTNRVVKTLAWLDVTERMIENNSNN